MRLSRQKARLADREEIHNGTTGNLDSKNAKAILDIFDEVHHRGVTVLVVTHDNRVAARADRIIEVSDGRILTAADD